MKKCVSLLRAHLVDPGQQRILAETGFQCVIEKIPERQIQGITYIRKNLDCGVLISQFHVPKLALGDTGQGCKPVDAVLFCISEIADSCSDVHDVTPFRYRDRITNLF